jgi:hypothetical protein
MTAVYLVGLGVEAELWESTQIDEPMVLPITRRLYRLVPT